MTAASAPAGRRSGRFQSQATEIGLAPSGCAEAPSAAPSSREDDVRGPLALGSMGVRGVVASHRAGRAALWMEGDLSPQDWNRPASRRATEAASRRATAAATWGMR